MTTQSIQIVTYDYGASLSSVTLRNLSTDVLVATADSCAEVTADSGLYLAVFGETSVIAAGEYRLRAVIGGKPLNRYVTLTGVDGEVAISRSEPTSDVSGGSVDLSEIKGVGWDASTDTLEKIRDAITLVSSISVVIPSPVSSVIGMPETLEIGDSYDEDTPIKLYVRDENDDPVTSFSGHDLTDPDFAPTFTIAPTPGSSRGRVVGTVTWIPASGPDEGYLKVEISSLQSRRAVEGESTVQCILKWAGYEKTILTTTVRWLPRI